MKTKEFIERVEELGFKVRRLEYIIGRKELEIHRVGYPATVAGVCENYRNMFNTNTAEFHMLPPKKQYELFFLLVDYADTPVEEREEPKKYYIRQKYIRNDWNYLNYNTDSKEWDFSSSDETYTFRVQFTLSELPDWVHEMLEQGHLIKEEVE